LSDFRFVVVLSLAAFVILIALASLQWIDVLK
jgi:hypothetical protein